LENEIQVVDVLDIFKISWLQEGELTERLVQRSDARELQTYYQQFYEKKIRDGEFSQRP